MCRRDLVSVLVVVQWENHLEEVLVRQTSFSASIKRREQGSTIIQRSIVEMMTKRLQSVHEVGCLDRAAVGLSKPVEQAPWSVVRLVTEVVPEDVNALLSMGQRLEEVSQLALRGCLH